MRKCRYCDSNFTGDVKYCPNCGAETEFVYTGSEYTSYWSKEEFVEQNPDERKIQRSKKSKADLVAGITIAVVFYIALIILRFVLAVMGA